MKRKRKRKYKHNEGQHWRQHHTVMNKQNLELIKAWAISKQITPSQLIRRVMLLFPFHKSGRINVTLSIPLDIANNKPLLSSWLSQAIAEVQERLGD